MVANLTTDKITPGPWKVNKYGSIGAGQYGTLPIVAAVEPLEGPDRKYGDHGANARLIAAAPTMHSKLERIATWVRKANEGDASLNGAIQEIEEICNE